MANARLNVDTTSVRNLAGNLNVVKSTLSSAQASSGAVAGMVGNARLAGVITDFASKWDDRRTELIDQVDQLNSAATSIADAFEQVDSELARALTEEPSGV